MANPGNPIVLITGAGGNLGATLSAALADGYRIVGIDRDKGGANFPIIEADLTSDDSTTRVLREFRERFGNRIASVIHLAAYFDFTGEDHPLYQNLNVEGTRRLLRALQDFGIDQFVYSGTMLVHAPCKPGERIDESQPIAPKWAYPKSKAAAEEVIRQQHGKIPYVLLHLAGVYDEHIAVPTLAQQIARIYEKDFQSTSIRATRWSANRCCTRPTWSTPSGAPSTAEPNCRRTSPSSSASQRRSAMTSCKTRSAG